MFSMTRSRCWTALFLGSLLAGGAGCTVAAGEDPAVSEAPLAEVSASAAATGLNIATWKIYPAESDFRILGVGTDGATVAEVVAHLTSDQEVDVRARLPEVGTFRLNREGVVSVGSESLRPLAGALHTDLGNGSALPATKPAAASGGDVGSTSSALSAAAQGQLPLGWSFFGSSGTVLLGTPFCPVRVGAAASARYGATCYVRQWYSASPTDCRIFVDFFNPGFHTDICDWLVYQNP